MRMDFHWNRPESRIAYDRSGGAAGRLFLANEARRLMDPYVPAKNLILAQNVRTYLSDGEGVVHYLSPYAHYQYEGILYVSSRTGSSWASAGEYKVPTDKQLEYSKARHPLATSHWDRAMMAARRTDLVNAYRRWLRSRE